MKIAHVKPPVYDLLKEKFPALDWEKGVAIAYKDTVYSKYPMPDHVLAHEEVHLKQQASMDFDQYVDMYLNDENFRFAQEVEAYQEQSRFIYKAVKDRNARFKMLHKLALELSGPLYGDLCSYQQAYRLLKHAVV